jgi:predicted NBD/HSP70 family sugar kinase
MAGGRATVRDLRRVNRAAVLRPLFLEGPLNRVVLSQLTGLSSGSITNVIGDLIEEGLVVEVGTEDSDGGRPRVQLQVNPDFGVVIGVDVGETGIRVEGFDLSMTELAGATVDVHPQEDDAHVVVAQIAEAVNELQRRFERERRPILGVGVAVPGVVEHDRDVHVHAPSIGWKAVPLGRLLGERVELPLFIENGAKTLGQAEMWLGAGRGAQHAVVTLWGTGVGAAMFADGRLYRGAASSAGEWGHTCVVIDGTECRCGASGCLEAYIGAAALLKEWARADPGVELPDDFEQEPWLDRLVAAAGTDAAGAVLERAATIFGTAAANLVNLFNPERIIVGGWAGLKLGPVLLPKIREVLGAQALDYPATRVTLELGRLGHDAVALGASTLVVEALLSRGGEPPWKRQESPHLLGRAMGAVDLSHNKN